MGSLNQGASIVNVLPVVARELRAESRRPVNYWLRVLAAAVIVGFFLGFALSTEIEVSQWGGTLFAVLYHALLLAVWIVVPLMTADCISFEKREGTLGLLFLTPLTVLDVLLGKAAIHALRATTLVLAALPMVVLPFVLGGVTWNQVLPALASVANALLLGIAAGMRASAKGGSSIQVMVWAEIYAAGLAIASAMFSGLSSLVSVDSWSGLLFHLAISIVFTAVAFWLLMKSSVLVLRETWHQDAAAPEQQDWVEMFSGSEFWRTVFHWERGRALDRNPMAWLQEYSWTARLTKWGWCIGMLWAEFFAVVAFPGSQPQLTAALSLGVAFSAAGSFRREKQAGLLEILLVTPLSVRQLTGGRLWGIFSHFFPALAVLAVCWNADRILNSKPFEANAFNLVSPNPLAFLALMTLGLYLSLWPVNFLASWLSTWALAFFLPAIVGAALVQAELLRPPAIVILTSAYQLLVAAASWFLLQRNMRERKFLAPPA